MKFSTQSEVRVTAFMNLFEYFPVYHAQFQYTDKNVKILLKNAMHIPD